mgnify:CR=1 FL=1
MVRTTVNKSKQKMIAIYVKQRHHGHGCREIKMQGIVQIMLTEQDWYLVGVKMINRGS